MDLSETNLKYLHTGFKKPTNQTNKKHTHRRKKKTTTKKKKQGRMVHLVKTVKMLFSEIACEIKKLVSR